MATVPRPLIRRSISIPTVVGAALGIAVLTIPVIPVLALIDLVTGPRTMRRTRAWLLVGAAVFTELAGVSSAAWVRIRHPRPDGPRAAAANFALMHWWVHQHARNLRRFAGVRWVVENPELARKGDAVVAARHASHVDALLPFLLFGVLGGFEVRYTLKSDLQWAPAMDIVGNRTNHVFVDRTPGPGSPLLEHLSDLAAGVNENSVTTIFPEGTFHTPAGHDRAVERLARNRPDLAEKARSLRYLLPPRPQGTRTLLRGAPSSDLVIVGHEGMEAFGEITDITRNLPLRHPVRVRLWRFERASIPSDDDELMTWLLDRWVEMDEWIARRADERARDIESIGGEEILA